MLTVSKLSKQQKAILEALYERYKEPCWFIPGGYWCHTSTLSWDVARKFNQAHNDRIWDDKQHKLNLIEQEREETKDLIDENGMYKDEESREKGIRRGRALELIFLLIDNCHRKKERLTVKHRASFSRSLKRLQERGLVTCYTDSELKEEEGGLVWVWYTGGRRNNYVKLTDKGIEVASQLLTVSGET